MISIFFEIPQGFPKFTRANLPNVNYQNVTAIQLKTKVSSADNILTCFELMHHTIMEKNIKNNKITGKMAADLSYLAHAYITSYKPSNTENIKY